MLESFNLNDELEYQKLSPDEQSKRGILGRLKGVIADFKNPTRNGRKYTESLWEQTFNNPIMQEKIKNKCLFGELGHPTDRQEVDMEKIAICMAEEPKKGSDGKLHAVFDILATPCGKILKTLCDYGCNIGISSRGSGETYTDAYGDEVVDKDTFECECWDAVLVPAVKDARLQYVNESYKDNGLKMALCESIYNATPSGKRIMEDVLKSLNIDYLPESADNKCSESCESTDNSGEELVEELQKSLKTNLMLEKKLTGLQEKLSVSYTKESKMRDTIDKYKVVVKSLTEESNKRKLQENKISDLEKDIEAKDDEILRLQKTIKNLQESKININSSKDRLVEEISDKETIIKTLQKQVKTLEESVSIINKSNSEEKNKLIENIEELKADSSIKNKEYSEKIANSNKLLERYRAIARKSVDKYIESKSLMLGVAPVEIKNRLKEGYTFKDIDDVCDELKNYRVNISKLPFDFSKSKNISMKVVESVEPIVPHNKFSDDIDSQLMSLAGLK